MTTDPDTPQSDILNKIRKLLRLADRSRGATENEAKVALSKAQDLMTRHNIDSALLRMEREAAGGKSGIEVTKGLFELPKSLNAADMPILSLLQSHFNVRIILMSGYRKTPVDIIGVPEDVDFAIFALSFLRATFFRCWNEFKRSALCPDRVSYYRGLYAGLDAELSKAKQKAEKSYDADDRQSYALAVVDQKAAITRYVDENYGKIRTRTQRSRRVDSASYIAGQAKGRTIQINRPLAG